MRLVLPALLVGTIVAVNLTFTRAERFKKVKYIIFQRRLPYHQATLLTVPRIGQ